MIFNFIFNLILIQYYRVLADNAEIKDENENQKLDDENKPLKHHIIHDDMKKAIFGSFIYDPVYQMFEDHHNVMPNSKEHLDLTAPQSNPFIPLKNATASISTGCTDNPVGSNMLKWKKGKSLKSMLAARKALNNLLSTPHIIESKNQTVL